MTKQNKLNIDLEFLDNKNSGPPPKKIEETQSNSLKTDTVAKVRPWVRYWARYLDVMIFSFIFGIFLAIFIPSILEKSNIVLTMLSLFAWIFVESMLLSSWGTTPGKWLLRISLKDVNGNKPTFSSALNRSFTVWFKGLGFGIPIVNLITLIISYNHLTQNGITSWDKDGHFTVAHKKIGIIRTIIAVIIFILSIFLIALGES